tara:strand:- start:73 stop:1581 length:1509 start_codon:yes stop_codon:yes gene_type:complete
MFAAIYIPNFLLQVRLGNAFEAQPAALLESPHSGNDNKARIIALNQAALQSEVDPGMTAAMGQARCGDLLLFHREPEIEEAGQEKLLQLAMGCTPDFENTSPGICLMDLGGANAGEGWEFGWDLIEELALDQQLRGQVGFASTPDLALLVAKQADPVRSIITNEGDEFLLRLPIEALDAPADLMMVLTLWGISTVGEFLALPQDEIAERLGPDALDLWERTSGKKSRLLRLFRTPSDFSQTTEFDYEMETLEPLLFVIRRLLETICARLSAVWMAAGEIHLQLKLSNGKDYRRDFKVPDPCCNVDLLFQMLHAHLENFVAKAAITGLQIKAIPARPTRSQFHLFESGLKDPNRFAETLARLEGLLGSGRVGIPEKLDSHKPDSVRAAPFLEKCTPSVLAVNHDGVSTGLPIGLPLRRFRPPIFANVTISPYRKRPTEIRSPVIQGKIRDLRGPWIVSGQWWGAYWFRTEWDIEVADSKSRKSGLYRLVREGKNDWKLDGVYG